MIPIKQLKSYEAVIWYHPVFKFYEEKKKIRKTFASSKRLDPPPFFYEKNEMETAFISFEFHLKTM